MQEIKWRFPHNNYGQEDGLDTSDVETFKKDPEASLAREICQNSIDANAGNFATRVEFKVFKVDKYKIPGIEGLVDIAERCYEYKKHVEKEEKPLKIINNNLKNENIICLRISDFNTTGLLGVKDNDSSKPFYMLTKGTGVSEKLNTSGGSKGIGKFASFVVSSVNTVFYSTRTEKEGVGYIGLSKMRSVPVSDDNQHLLTQGKGYYGSGERNLPIHEELNLDHSFVRNTTDYGTDVYIIGFNNYKGWENAIVAKILDSFMVAIIKNGFEVIVGDITINKETVHNIIYNTDILEHRPKREVKDIVAQYELLTEEDVLKETVFIEDNEVVLCVKKYSRAESNKASKRCIMVRYPYMKILYKTGYSVIPFTALCIIENNELNKKLRAIENPQHTDWEMNRLNDYPEEKRRTRDLKKQLEMEIGKFIDRVLKQGNEEVSEVVGAEEFLPDVDEGDNDGTKSVGIVEKLVVTTLQESKAISPKRKKVDDKGEGLEFSKGEQDGEEDEIRNPNDTSTLPEPNLTSPGENPTNANGGSKVGKDPILKKVALNGMKIRNIAVDSSKGCYDIVFKSEFNEACCELVVKMCGEGQDKYAVEILDAYIDGEKVTVDAGVIKNITLKKGKLYKIKYNTNEKKLFSSEVVINACR